MREINKHTLLFRDLNKMAKNRQENAFATVYKISKFMKGKQLYIFYRHDSFLQRLIDIWQHYIISLIVPVRRRVPLSGIVREILFIGNENGKFLVGQKLVGKCLDANQLGHFTTVRNIRTHEVCDRVKHIRTNKLPTKQIVHMKYVIKQNT